MAKSRDLSSSNCDKVMWTGGSKIITCYLAEWMGSKVQKYILTMILGFENPSLPKFQENAHWSWVWSISCNILQVIECPFARLCLLNNVRNKSSTVQFKTANNRIWTETPSLRVDHFASCTVATVCVLLKTVYGKIFYPIK